MERLATANKTLCLAGDSIDLQFYYALRNNLLRASRLRERDGGRPAARPGANASVAAERLIPVAYTNATSGPVDYSIYWMCMREIRETLVTLRRGDGGERVARIWFFKMYGRSPWITFFMDECDVLILNLGLHYDARGAMIGQHYGPNRLEDDFRAAVTFLAGFASSRTPGEGRTAVWQSALPQHFGGPIGNGHYERGSTNCSLVARRSADGGGGGSDSELQQGLRQGVRKAVSSVGRRRGILRKVRPHVHRERHEHVEPDRVQAPR